ncbi:HAD-IA family hydrolase [Streptacidiphilus anmyonensis]|uniref:HAD-IA family hydrolase n=1 Tax=Streptacidiphilus anmyonensis TaxID=405782 RepID=UPI000A9EBF68|nr:HAD-IA family hydrolase [Streptacidiphilus anmyonensis]
MTAHSSAPAVLTVDAVLFDNDGTLIDSVSSVRRSWARWAEEAGLAPERLDEVGYLGRRVHEVIGELLPEAQVAAAAARVQQLELADAPNSRLLPGAEELLSALPRDRWAVVTATTRTLALRRFSTLGLTVPMLVGAEDVRRGHPDPEAFLTAADRLGVEPARCLVVEDAPAGLAAGRAAGMRTLALATSHEPADLEADVMITDLSQVRPLVERDGSLALLIG